MAREFNNYFCILVLFTFEAQSPAVILDNAVADAQPETGALAFGFRGEKRIGHLVDHRGRDPTAVIFKANPHKRMTLGGYRSDDDFQFFALVGICKFFVKGMPGIADDVHEDLLDFVGLRHYVQLVVWQICFDNDIVLA